MSLPSLVEHNRRHVPRAESSTGCGLACPKCDTELKDDPKQKLADAGKPPSRNVSCPSCKHTDKRLLQFRSDLQQEEALILKALQDAEAAEQEEMVTSKLPTVTKNRDGEEDDGWPGYAKNVYDKFFSAFPKLSAKIAEWSEEIVSRGWVISPTHRRRTMYRVLTENRKFVADAVRRAVNSPIQGFSSENGVMAAYLIMLAIDDYVNAWGLDHRLHTSLFTRAVHDANYFESSLRMLLPEVHIHQHIVVVELPLWYERTFGIKIILPHEIEMDIGAGDADAEAWNWVIADLPPLIRKAIKAKVANGSIAAEREEAAFRTAMGPWVRRDERRYLQEHFPLMQVPDLEAQICAAVRKAGLEPEE